MNNRLKITIESIEAVLINASTNEKDDFLIDHWIIKYEIIIEEQEHTVQGWLKWNATPNPYMIIKFINWFYGKRNTNSPQPS